MANPISIGVDAMLLIHVPRALVVLPMYIVFLALIPAIIVALCRSQWMTIAVSAALYGAVQLFPSLTLYSYPEGKPWGFNVFAWQLIFVLGAAAGNAKVRRQDFRWLNSRWVISLTFPALLMLAMAVVFTGHHRLMHALCLDGIASHLPQQFPCSNKPAEGVLRLINLLLLVVAGRAICNWLRLHERSICSPLVVCGQNSLAVFCIALIGSEIGTLLAYKWQGPLFWVAANIAGTLLSCGVAAGIATFRLGRGMTAAQIPMPNALLQQPAVQR